MEGPDKQRPFRVGLKPHANSDKYVIDSRISSLGFIKVKSQALAIGIMPVPHRDKILIDFIPQ